VLIVKLMGGRVYRLDFHLGKYVGREVSVSHVHICTAGLIICIHLSIGKIMYVCALPTHLRSTTYVCKVHRPYPIPTPIFTGTHTHTHRTCIPTPLSPPSLYSLPTRVPLRTPRNVHHGTHGPFHWRPHSHLPLSMPIFLCT